MSTPAQPGPRRALSGLPRRTDSGVSRLMRSNREPAQPGPATAPVRPSSAPPSAQPGQDEAPTDSVSNRVAESPLPRYLRLVRREARVHDHQVDELGRLTRRLNEARRRPGGKPVGERITDNTLLRVAIDLLLEHQDHLAGATETELRASLGITPGRTAD